MEVYSQCAVRAITDSTFLSPFSSLLSKWKQVFRALNCAFQQLPQKLLWLCVKAVKSQTCYFTKASIRIHYRLTRQLVEPFRSAFICFTEGTETSTCSFCPFLPGSWENQSGRFSISAEDSVLSLVITVCPSVRSHQVLSCSIGCVWGFCPELHFNQTVFLQRSSPKSYKSGDPT